MTSCRAGGDRIDRRGDHTNRCVDPGRAGEAARAGENAVGRASRRSPGRAGPRLRCGHRGCRAAVPARRWRRRGYRRTRSVRTALQPRCRRCCGHARRRSQPCTHPRRRGSEAAVSGFRCRRAVRGPAGAATWGTRARARPIRVGSRVVRRGWRGRRNDAAGCPVAGRIPPTVRPPQPCQASSRRRTGDRVGRAVDVAARRRHAGRPVGRRAAGPRAANAGGSRDACPVSLPACMQPSGRSSLQRARGRCCSTTGSSCRSMPSRSTQEACVCSGSVSAYGFVSSARLRSARQRKLRRASCS